MTKTKSFYSIRHVYHDDKNLRGDCYVVADSIAGLEEFFAQPIKPLRSTTSALRGCVPFRLDEGQLGVTAIGRVVKVPASSPLACAYETMKSGKGYIVINERQSAPHQQLRKAHGPSPRFTTPFEKNARVITVHLDGTPLGFNQFGYECLDMERPKGFGVLRVDGPALP